MNYREASTDGKKCLIFTDEDTDSGQVKSTEKWQNQGLQCMFSDSWALDYCT